MNKKTLVLILLVIMSFVLYCIYLDVQPVNEWGKIDDRFQYVVDVSQDTFIIYNSMEQYRELMQMDFQSTQELRDEVNKNINNIAIPIEQLLFQKMSYPSECKDFASKYNQMVAEYYKSTMLLKYWGETGDIQYFDDMAVQFAVFGDSIDNVPSLF